MKYIESAWSPLRIRRSPRSARRARSTPATAAMRAASSVRKRGTFATRFQVSTNSRRRTASMNAEAIMPTGIANMHSPITAVSPPAILPHKVTGVTSP